MWIDSHLHLDAPEFDADREAVVARARAAGVTGMVLPAVAPSNFGAVRTLAHQLGAGYALGIHPLWIRGVGAGALDELQQALRDARDDPHLVAVGEIGLDHFVPGLDRAEQAQFYRAQLKLARDAGLPVLLHVRRSADDLLAGLRRIEVPGGLAHAFNGSAVQARRFIDLGFALGFGGAMTFDRALQIRRLAVEAPPEALALETDAPDIPPHWLYRTAAERAPPAPEAEGPGVPQGRNEPAELPRIGAVLAALRGLSVEAVRDLTSANVRRVLPRLDGALAVRSAIVGE
jgi:TatD DNase family protein